MSRLPFLAFALFLALLPRAASAADCQFVLGFKEYRDFHGHEVIGECLENEQWEMYGAFQRTTKGTLHWYKDGNYVVFIPNVTQAPKPTPTPIPTAEPQQESIECRDGELLRPVVIRHFRDQGLTKYWIDLSMRQLEVVFGTYTWACKTVKALGYPVTQNFETAYWKSQSFLHFVWCVIEPNLDEDQQAYMESALSTYPGNRGNAWNDYLLSDCRQGLTAAAQAIPTPTPDPTATPTPAPYVDPRLESAIRVMRTTETGEDAWRWFLASGASMTIVDFPESREYRVYGAHSPADRRIDIAPSIRHDLPWVAAVLVHEIVHAWIDAFAVEDYTGAEGCFDEEILAFSLEAKWWLEYYGRGGRSGRHRENGILFMYLDGTLDDWVRSHEGYQEQCAA